MVKISIIGAGSAVFSLNLVKDLCVTEGLWDSTITLMDIDAGRLDVVHRLATRYTRESSINVTFEQTTTLDEALRDADFIINTAYVKGHSYAKQIRDVATTHGYYYYRDHFSIPEPGPPALTNFEQLTVMLEIAQQMENTCPDAVLLQASNPVLELTTLLSRETDLTVWGLCHGHLHYRQIASTLGIDPSQVSFEAPGLNHCIWLTKFRYQETDAYPLIDAWIESRATEYWRTHVFTGPFDTQMSPAAVHQYQLYGLFPIGDTVRNGGWWYHTNFQVKQQWYGEPWGGPDTEQSRPYHVTQLMKRQQTIQQLLEESEGKLMDAIPLHRSQEQHIPIIDAIVNDHENQFQVNVLNQGTLPGLSNDVAVEIPVRVNKYGIQRMPVAELPRKLMVEVLLPRWLAMEHVLEAFRSGDRSMLLWNILQHHHVSSLEAAETLLEDWLSMPASTAARKRFI